MPPVEEPAAHAGDMRRGLDTWARKIPWRRAWNPLLYSSLANPADRGAWRDVGHRQAKIQAGLSSWAQTPGYLRSEGSDGAGPAGQGRWAAGRGEEGSLGQPGFPWRSPPGWTDLWWRLASGTGPLSNINVFYKCKFPLGKARLYSAFRAPLGSAAS